MKKIVPVLFLKDKEVYSDKKCCTKVQDDLSPVEICLRLEAAGADEFLIMDLSYDDASHDAAGRQTFRSMSEAALRELRMSKNICMPVQEELSLMRLSRPIWQ